MTRTTIRDRYGKADVRLVRLARDGGRHELRELIVGTTFEGDFEASFRAGDNRSVLPTDTMKNAVYVLARDHGGASIEAFADRLAAHLLAACPGARQARVEIAETPWTPIHAGGAAHAAAHVRGGGERATCAVARTATGATVTAGLDGLVIAKTAGSGFSRFLRDPLTTLRDTDDRILRTSLTASWAFAADGADHVAARAAIRDALLDAFATHESLSVQHTLHAMAERALAACRDISSVTLSMPNRHCLLVDLAPFGLTNDNVVFMPVEEPSGVIEATIARA